MSKKDKRRIEDQKGMGQRLSNPTEKKKKNDISQECNLEATARTHSIFKE